MDPQQLMQQGLKFAEQAISRDNAGEHDVAQFFYIEASDAILKAISLDESLMDAKVKALQYIERAEVLQNVTKGMFSYTSRFELVTKLTYSVLDETLMNAFLE